MKAHPADIITKIAQQSGTGRNKAQQQIITEHLDVPEFVKTVRYALDPFMNFYVATVPGLSDIAAKARRQSDEAKKGIQDLFDDQPKRLPWKEQFSTMFSILDKLSSRQLAPNSSDARNAILDWAKNVGPGTIDCFRKILNKDLRCNVGVTTFNKMKPGWIREFKIQLAKPFDEKKLVFPCYVDPKFDGERCLAFVSRDVTDGSVTYFSRNGLQFQNYKCFDSSVLKLTRGMGQIILDCEVVHRDGFQSGQKVPSNFDPSFDGSKLRLMVFDFITQDAFDKLEFDLTQSQRNSELNSMFRGFTADNVVKVDTRLAKDLNEAYEIYNYWVDNGLEGVILKQPEGYYQFSRTDAWIKIKPTHSEDLKIVGIELGDTKKRWAGKCGSIVVERKDKSGNIVKVNVASGLTEWHHENIVESGNEIHYKTPNGELLNIKGKIIEVYYDCETEDGSLRFPRVRDKGSLIRLDK